MLTRHFYCLDEVTASLWWAVKHRKTQEAFFWAREYVHGTCSPSAFKDELLNIWFLVCGIASLDWLLSFDKKEAAELLLQLCEQTHRESSTYCIAIEGASARPPTGRSAPPPHPSALETGLPHVERGWWNAVRHHKMSRAWGFGRLLYMRDADAYWRLCHRYLAKRLEQAEDEAEKEERGQCFAAAQRLQQLTAATGQNVDRCIQCACAATLVACMRPGQIFDSVSTETVAAAAAANVKYDDPCVLDTRPPPSGDRDWMRKARRYAIPQDALYAATDRGSGAAATTLPILWDWPRHICSPFWSHVFSKKGVGAAWSCTQSKWIFPSDLAFEEHTDKWFYLYPDEEWPLEEQLKSFGPALPDATRSFDILEQSMSCIWLTVPTPFAWLSWKTACHVLANELKGVGRPCVRQLGLAAAYKAALPQWETAVKAPDSGWQVC
jgi:hypothetical protein